MNRSVSMSDGKQILYIVNAGYYGVDESFAGYGRRDDILKKPIASKICRNIKNASTRTQGMSDAYYILARAYFSCWRWNYEDLYTRY